MKKQIVFILHFSLLITLLSCLGDRNAPFNLVECDNGKMNGQPCIRGMRITVKRVLEIISTYETRKEIFSEFPELTEEDIKQSLDFVSVLLRFNENRTFGS